MLGDDNKTLCLYALCSCIIQLLRMLQKGTTPTFFIMTRAKNEWPLALAMGFVLLIHILHHSASSPVI